MHCEKSARQVEITCHCEERSDVAIRPPPGDFFFAGESLSAPCGGTSPKGGGKGDVGTDCRVGPLGLLAMTGLETWLPLWGSWHGEAVTERAGG